MQHFTTSDLQHVREMHINDLLWEHELAGRKYQLCLTTTCSLFWFRESLWDCRLLPALPPLPTADAFGIAGEGAAGVGLASGRRIRAGASWGSSVVSLCEGSAGISVPQPNSQALACCVPSLPARDKHPSTSGALPACGVRGPEDTFPLFSSTWRGWRRRTKAQLAYKLPGSAFLC